MREPTEMELRVQRAVLDAANDEDRREDRCCLSNEDGFRVARAAIRAIHEATKAMIIAGNDEVQEHCYTDGYASTGYSTVFEPWCALKTFQAMIDAASPPD